MKCKACKYIQYCEDCQEEVNLERTPEFKSGKAVIYENFLIIGNTIYLNGRPFRITHSSNGSPNKRYYTKEGFLFFVRERDRRLVLIKTQKDRNEKKPECLVDEYSMLKGKRIPSELKEDSNW